MIKYIINYNEKVSPNDREMSVLRENFPSCFKSDGSFDIERFKEFLNDRVAVTHEGYELKFLGKNYARLLAAEETTTVISPDVEHNSRPENANSENIYISADNLDALKHLVKSYAGCVKCIYIDPPYNTGKDDFIYKDNFNFTIEELSVRLSIDFEQAERILDLTKRASASHSAWLMFMYPRLLLARDLLSKDGVIFISIDDNEQANLKLLCDDIFNEQNFIGCLILQTATDNNPQQINTEHEYILCYAKDKASLDFWQEESEKAKLIQEKYLELKSIYNDDITTIQTELRKWIKKNVETLKGVSHYDNVDEKGVFHDGDVANTVFGGYKYDVIHPITGKPCKIPDKGFRFAEATMREMLENNDIMFGADETTLIKPKKRLENAKDLLRSVIYEDGRSSTKHFESLMARDIFQNPKSHTILKRLISFVLKSNDIVLDFFSGSATTAESVMLLNTQKPDLNLKYIMVQLPENLDESLLVATDKAKKTLKNAITFLDSIDKPHILDQIGQERIVRAAKQIKEDNPDTTADLGFKHYTLYEPSTETLDKLESFSPDQMFSNLLDEFGVPTVLTTWLVRDGYGFTAKYETLDFAGYEAYYCGKHLYLINEGLSDEAITAICEKLESDANFNPENIVLFGYSFTWGMRDTLQINVKRLKDTEKNLRVNFDVRY